MRYLSTALEKLETRKQVNLKNYEEKHMTIPEAKRTARIIEWRQLPEKLAGETVSPPPASGGIVIPAHGVEAEFPSGTDIGILAAFVKAVGHA